MIACTFDKEVVKIWNIDNEGIQFTIEFRIDSMLTIKLSGYTDFLSWSPDGRFIAVENDVSSEREQLSIERDYVYD